MKQFLQNPLRKIVLGLFICLVMVILVYGWSSIFHQFFTGGAQHFFKSERITNIKDTALTSVKEEIEWRFLPFLIATIPIVLFKKRPKIHKTLLIVSTILITLIQLRFGYAHYHPGNESQDWVIKHIIIQGFMGICFAITYASVVFLCYYNSRNKIVALLAGNVVAVIASSLVHTASNTMLIISQTFI